MFSIEVFKEKIYCVLMVSDNRGISGPRVGDNRALTTVTAPLCMAMGEFTPDGFALIQASITPIPEHMNPLVPPEIRSLKL